MFKLFKKDGKKCEQCDIKFDKKRFNLKLELVIEEKNKDGDFEKKEEFKSSNFLCENCVVKILEIINQVAEIELDNDD